MLWWFAMASTVLFALAAFGLGILSYRALMDNAHDPFAGTGFAGLFMGMLSVVFISISIFGVIALWRAAA